jgi:hypothetical protein
VGASSSNNNKNSNKNIVALSISATLEDILWGNISISAHLALQKYQTP